MPCSCNTLLLDYFLGKTVKEGIKSEHRQHIWGDSETCNSVIIGVTINVTTIPAWIARSFKQYQESIVSAHPQCI